MQNRFIVLVTVHNSVEWIKKCLDSVLLQDYKNYRFLIIDDHSTDGTWDIVNKYDGCLIRNDTNMIHSLVNMVTGLKAFFFDPEDIIVCLDGDDWFYDNTVLTYLNEVYQEDIWLTYGQYIPLSGKYKDYCCPLSEAKTLDDPNIYNLNCATYRKSKVWVTSHLKTFKKKCWDWINEDDFKMDGRWIVTCGDVAMMIPIIEMAGDKRIRFIDKVLYVYNDLNPMNHTKYMANESLITAEYLRSKPNYELIN